MNHVNHPFFWLYDVEYFIMFIFFSFIKSRFFVVQWWVKLHHYSIKLQLGLITVPLNLVTEQLFLMMSLCCAILFGGGGYFADMMLVAALPVWTPSSLVEGSAKTTRSASHARWLSAQCELSVPSSSTAFGGFKVQDVFNFQDHWWSQKKCILILCCAL